MTETFSTIFMLLWGKAGLGRAGRHMTRRELASQMGMPEVTVGQTLNGRRLWSIEDVETMARIFEVPVTRFFEDPEALFPGLATSGARGGT